ncbi:M1 family metallopeptidase [Flavisolibacter nicotianae]|uniref:M1 family metallopeptidase n=1 Tax=Flavisolibacter nicotianae TaxID=2364882 RepID=UPI000EB2B300|nr:M1 family metallopeptidase [Flavisolibacter nicotianae]
MKTTILSLFLFSTFSLFAQPDRWQQRIKYTMAIDMNVQTNQFTGKQSIQYWNNSPDTLHKVFFHLYWNAFQPGSMMDERSRRQGGIQVPKGNTQGPDWDARVKDRIINLKPDEIGYEKVAFVKMNGREQKTKLHETILEVVLDRPILPKSQVSFDLQWDAQVPLQVRRSGRDNPNSNVRYTMTQWYPKMAEYDYEGWHPTPYVGREFYGVWGDYDVTISIDKTYILGGSGYLQNASQVGYGYEEKGTTVQRPAGNKLVWKFTAPNVHDFAWAADPDFVHLSKKIRPDLTLHVLYDKTDKRVQEWNEVLPKMEKIFPFVEKHFGAYPYKQYSWVHGGDGGMEYPMTTMISGPGDGVTVHEFLHSWYQGMMGTNESLYPWMDEGFTTFAEEETLAFLNKSQEFPHEDSYNSYFALAKSGLEEPMTTHADHYNTNFAYSIASYSKGSVFLSQLGYIVSDSVRNKILLEYYRQWRFKHPNASDFVRVAEKVSGLKLDWYKEYWISSTKTIDYGIDSLWETGGATTIRLSKIGMVPMPVDVRITFKDGSSEWHYIPAYEMFGEKPAEPEQRNRKVYPEWRWTSPTYNISTGKKLTDITTVEIDPSGRMADGNWKNNKIELKW